MNNDSNAASLSSTNCVNGWKEPCPKPCQKVAWANRYIICKTNGASWCVIVTLAACAWIAIWQRMPFISYRQLFSVGHASASVTLP